MYTRKSGYSSFVLLLGNLRNVKALNSLPAGCLGEWDRRKKEGGRKFTIANYPPAAATFIHTTKTHHLQRPCDAILTETWDGTGDHTLDV